MHIPATDTPSFHGCSLSSDPKIVVRLYAGSSRAVEEQVVRISACDVNHSCHSRIEGANTLAESSAKSEGIVGRET